MPASDRRLCQASALWAQLETRLRLQEEQELKTQGTMSTQFNKNARWLLATGVTRDPVSVTVKIYIDFQSDAAEILHETQMPSVMGLTRALRDTPDALCDVRILQVPPERQLNAR